MAGRRKHRGGNAERELQKWGRRNERKAYIAEDL